MFERPWELTSPQSPLVQIPKPRKLAPDVAATSSVSSALPPRNVHVDPQTDSSTEATALCQHFSSSSHYTGGRTAHSLALPHHVGRML
ncbi:unnamed protein product [Prunus armeniaca]